MIAGLLLIPIGELLVRSDGSQIGLLLFVTLLGGIACSAIVLATRYGDVAVIAPFRYSRHIFAILLGIFF